METVLSLQFKPIDGFRVIHVGLLWSNFRDRFPLVEDHPPLRAEFETFIVPSKRQMEVTIHEKPPLPRVWFLNESRTELIQVQPDRFIHNWRRMSGPSESYPRYERVRSEFRQEVESFAEFLSNEQLGQIVVNQCEVTYANHIEPCDVWERHGQMQAVFRNWTSIDSGGFLPEMEDGTIHQRFIMPGEADEPAGRLHVSVTPVWNADSESPILNLTLTARGKPLGDGIDGAFSFFDKGREWIVKGFADLTTGDMHRVWERIGA